VKTQDQLRNEIDLLRRSLSFPPDFFFSTFRSSISILDPYHLNLSQFIALVAVAGVGTSDTLTIDDAHAIPPRGFP